MKKEQLDPCRRIYFNAYITSTVLVPSLPGRCPCISLQWPALAEGLLHAFGHTWTTLSKQHCTIWQDAINIPVCSVLFLQNDSTFCTVHCTMIAAKMIQTKLYCRGSLPRRRTWNGWIREQFTWHRKSITERFGLEGLLQLLHWSTTTEWHTL